MQFISDHGTSKVPAIHWDMGDENLSEGLTYSYFSAL